MTDRNYIRTDGWYICGLLYDRRATSPGSAVKFEDFVRQASRTGYEPGFRESVRRLIRKGVIAQFRKGNALWIYLNLKVWRRLAPPFSFFERVNTHIKIF
jgi:hypothetical protein